jgi:hypothetical protein
MLTKENVAKSLYNHWKSSAYELRRQPDWHDAPESLRGVFLRQGEAVVQDRINDYDKDNDND